MENANEGRRGAGRDVARIGGGAHGDGRDIEGELTYLGKGFIALVFMIGTLAGLTSGFLALLAFRLAGGTDSCCIRLQRDALQAIMDQCG